MLEFFFIFIVFVPILLAGPAFVYVVALGAIVSPARQKLQPLHRLILFGQATVLFYALSAVWWAVATSQLLGEFNMGERHIDPRVMFSIIAVPVLAAIIGRLWIKRRYTQ